MKTKMLLVVLLLTANHAVMAGDYIPTGSFFNVAWTAPTKARLGEQREMSFDVTSDISGPNNSSFKFPSRHCKVSGLTTVHLASNRVDVRMSELTCIVGGTKVSYPMSAFMADSRDMAELPGDAGLDPDGVAAIYIAGPGNGKVFLLQGLSLR